MIWSIPDACDSTGSPYAVRDFFHLRGTLSRRCIQKGIDEYSLPYPCWANQELDTAISSGAQLGLDVWLDVSVNHMGHNYLYYDTFNHVPVSARLQQNPDVGSLWDFKATFDPALLKPVLFDSEDLIQKLKSSNSSEIVEFMRQCPGLFTPSTSDPLLKVRNFLMWREAFAYERSNWNCNATFLEQGLFAFYLGSNSIDPSTGPSSFFHNEWVDVKFLFHRESNVAHQFEFARVREYCFRIFNYWASRGVRGFRLDHTTDPNSGMSANEWLYILNKVNFYAQMRGQQPLSFLAEEFHEQQAMAEVVDAMTEGYVGDMCARNGATKDASFVENVLRGATRFGTDTFVMTALETHDEKRLLESTGFDIWTGAGFWSIGLSRFSMPMLLMGQEFGEPYGLGFRRPDFLRSRFEGTSQYNPQGADLVSFYSSLIRARRDPLNAALLSPSNYFLRTKDGNQPDGRIFADLKFSSLGAPAAAPIVVINNLWLPDVAQTYYIPPEAAKLAGIDDEARYNIVDAVSNKQLSSGIGRDLKWSLPVFLTNGTRVQWLRLDRISNM